MARSDVLGQLDLASLSDDELEELLTKVQTAFDERVQNRMEEFRRIAAKAGYEVSLSKIRDIVEQRGRQRGSNQTSGSNRRQPVLPKYRSRKITRKLGQVEAIVPAGSKHSWQLAKPLRI